MPPPLPPPPLPPPVQHLRNVFHRMGLSDKDIVALSGAHTLGRARPERSGFGKKETKYTKVGAARLATWCQAPLRQSALQQGPRALTLLFARAASACQPAAHHAGAHPRAPTPAVQDGPGAPGGSSWTVQWLKFDNSYFK